MFEGYGRKLRTIGITLEPKIWLLISFFSALITGFVLAQVDVLLGVAASIAVLDLLLGIPVVLAEKRITKIEENLPDALKQMASVLRAGGTYEMALREVVQSEYEELSDEIARVLREMEEGKTFVDAMLSMSERIDSNIVRRVNTILVDAVRAGGGLADVLDEIAEDVREINRIMRERRARTTMQVIFMISAGIFLAPAIMGAVLAILDFLLDLSLRWGIMASAIGAGMNVQTLQKALLLKGFLAQILAAYVLIESVFVSLMVSKMREGKFTKTLLYAPLFILLAYLSFLGGKTIVGGLIR